jgi:hypothetical protein
MLFFCCFPHSDRTGPGSNQAYTERVWLFLRSVWNWSLYCKSYLMRIGSGWEIPRSVLERVQLFSFKKSNILQLPTTSHSLGISGITLFSTVSCPVLKGTPADGVWIIPGSFNKGGRLLRPSISAAQLWIFKSVFYKFTLAADLYSMRCGASTESMSDECSV